MLQKFRIAKEKNKLKLKLLKHASYCLERNNNPELLRAVAELLKKVRALLITIQLCPLL
ncbi:hypothetical protein B953_02089 [Staphylococcus aureus M0171]|nr:hypothetical protein B953_02639 [Staphylococcus aureus M0171]ENI92535.1 hypothetical protein B953_02089 [Staphylococcus aureus M0171]